MEIRREGGKKERRIGEEERREEGKKGRSKAAYPFWFRVCRQFNS